ncbi:hypothetical protein EJB05_04137 [Eragrostis curvula]|uniref:Knottin scorpion toxin-like domain-containing protein n=1 Tax=Eragrostis curvula TaxID=38414 RepID=A0A5J9W976_9POAL|nr:hypothetical protein EJB05_04137 [Eragrostis curvula]
MVGAMKSKNILFPLVLLIVIVIASQEDMVMRVAGVDFGPCGIFANGDCVERCFKPGKCDECCKNHGFHHGKCQDVACFCCTE